MKTIRHLFPDRMSLYGEYANVTLLEKRLTDAGEKVEVRPILFGDELDLTDCDFLYIGGGIETAMLAVLRELRKNTGMIESYVQFGGQVLATGNAAALFARSIIVYGEEAQGLSIADYDVVLNHTRRYAEYIMTTELVSSPVVGSINTSMEFTESASPMFRVRATSDKKKTFQTEGYMVDGICATSLIGPLLVRNPDLLTYFAEKISGKTLPESEQPWLDYAERGYRHVLDTLTREIREKG